MTCLICGEPATAVDVGDGYEERQCEKCGHYRVTVNTIELLNKNGWHFDVDLSRIWLGQQQGYGFIPTIDSAEAERLIGV